MKADRLASSLRLLVLSAAIGLLSSTAFSSVSTAPPPFVSPIFGDNMVLQRGRPNTLWGWAKPGQEVRITVADHTATTVTKDDGRWSAAIEPPSPGGPYTLVIDGPQHVELREVLVGDVWLCGGQSNMEMALAQARNGSEEVQAADHPKIRFFMVRQHVAYTPAAVPEGSWKIGEQRTTHPGRQPCPMEPPRAFTSSINLAGPMPSAFSKAPLR